MKRRTIKKKKKKKIQKGMEVEELMRKEMTD